MKWPLVKFEFLRATTRNSFVGGPFGSNLVTSDYVDEGVPVIRGANLPFDQLFRDNDFVFVSEDKAARLASNCAFPDDIIFTQRGTLGQVGLIPKDSNFPRYVISQSQMKLTVNPLKACPKFIYYFFRHPETKQKVINSAITSGVPHINLGILRDFDVPLPPLDSQNRIVDVLSAYDDLIENNRRRMALLEESARLLYREWFVYLHFPSYTRNRVTDGVPKGWKRQTLGEHLVLNYGKALKAEDRVDGDIPVYGSSGIVGTHDKALSEGPGIILGRKGNVGSVYWSPTAFYAIDTVYFIAPNKSDLYLFHALKHMHFINTDVAVPGLNRDMAYSRPLLLPSKTVQQHFLEVVNPVYEQIIKLNQQNQKLRAARDLLLPRLMSGEIAP